MRCPASSRCGVQADRRRAHYAVGVTRDVPRSPDQRIEPTADWRHVEFRPHGRQSAPAWRSRARWRWAAGIVAALAVALVLFRQPLSDRLWPGSHVQALLDEGDAALRAGRLSAIDGSGARQKYEAAQALDGDRSEARAGLARVANAALGQARAATGKGDFQQAWQALALARELQAPRAETEAVAGALRQREAVRAGIPGLLQQAEAARIAHRLDGGADAALPSYARILALQPDNTAALEGREDALADLLQQARQALDAGDLVRGAALVSVAQGYDPGHVDLPAAQALLSRVLDRQRQHADADLRRQRLPQALAGYRAVQAAASADVAQGVAAARGIERVAQAHAAQSRRFAADFEFARADSALRLARELAPQNAEVRAAADYLERLRRQHAQRGAASSSPQDQRRVQALLADMARAEARGDWIEPPGDSAYDKLRAAQSLAPADPAVDAAARRLLPAVRGCFEGALRDNQPRSAHACYDAWQALDPDSPGLAGARRRLAQSWVSVGAERLGTGDVAYAREALQRARSLDARAPGLGQLQARADSVRTP